EASEARPTQHVEDEHRVISHHGPAGFGNNRRMGSASLVADFLDVEDDIVGVFLKAVVDGGFEVGFRAIVIDAQPAADVDVLQASAEALKLGVNAGQLDDGVFDVVNVVDLRAQ